MSLSCQMSVEEECQRTNVTRGPSKPKPPNPDPRPPKPPVPPSPIDYQSQVVESVTIEASDSEPKPKPKPKPLPPDLGWQSLLQQAIKGLESELANIKSCGPRDPKPPPPRPDPHPDGTYGLHLGPTPPDPVGHTPYVTLRDPKDPPPDGVGGKTRSSNFPSQNTNLQFYHHALVMVN